MSQPFYLSYSPEHQRNANAKRKYGRRHHPTTADMDYSGHEMEFMSAVQEFKRSTGKKFPTLCEILGVLRSLGYSKSQDDQENTKGPTGGESPAGPSRFL